MDIIYKCLKHPKMLRNVTSARSETYEQKLTPQAFTFIYFCYVLEYMLHLIFNLYQYSASTCQMKISPCLICTN